jgi:hypothetical protein
VGIRLAPGINLPAPTGVFPRYIALPGIPSAEAFGTPTITQE